MSSSEENPTPVTNNLVNFVTKAEVGIEFITSVFSYEKGVTYNIYTYNTNTDCKRIFDLSRLIKYIGFIKEGRYYIVNLNDEDFSETFKNNFQFINESTIQNTLEITKMMNRVRNLDFKYINNFPPDCTEIVDLNRARHYLGSLNEVLSNSEYSIDIKYVFEMEQNTKVTSYNFDIKDILLCMYNNSNCVASLTVSYDDKKKQVWIDSRTNEFHGNKNLNKLLRAAIIIIAKSIYPNAMYVSSLALNPASAYLMIKYFHASAHVELEEPGIIESVIFKDEHTPDSIKKQLSEKITQYGGVFTNVELNETNIDNANRQFQKLRIKTNGGRSRKRRKTRGGRSRKRKRKIHI